MEPGTSVRVRPLLHALDCGCEVTRCLWALVCVSIRCPMLWTADVSDQMPVGASVRERPLLHALDFGCEVTRCLKLLLTALLP